MRILMILIPESDTADGKGDPAVRLERAAGPYYVFRDADVEVVLASSGGGSPLMEFTGDDAVSTELVQRFRQDRIAADEFSDTIGLDQVYTEDFDAAFCVGVPGSIWQPEHRNTAGALIARLLDVGKPVAVTPSGVNLAPKGASNGLLIVSDGSKSPVTAAHALLGAIGRPPIKPERNVP
jgi:putative intracellular protease/amidase